MRAALDITAFGARRLAGDEHCGDDVANCEHEVERLLAADAVASGVLDQPLGEPRRRGSPSVPIRASGAAWARIC
jgi:hypothetical protein